MIVKRNPLLDQIDLKHAKLNNRLNFKDHEPMNM